MCEIVDKARKSEFKCRLAKSLNEHSLAKGIAINLIYEYTIHCTLRQLATWSVCM